MTGPFGRVSVGGVGPSGLKLPYSHHSHLSWKFGGPTVKTHGVWAHRVHQLGPGHGRDGVPELVLAPDTIPASLVGLRPRPTAGEAPVAHHGVGRSVADGDAI